jgi:hypothetical protein
MVEHLENIGPHYATTLASWRQRFWSMLRTRQQDEQNRVREAKAAHDRYTLARQSSSRSSNGNSNGVHHGESKRSASSSSSSSPTVTDNGSTLTHRKQKMALTYSHVNEQGQLPRGADPTRDERFIRMWYVYCFSSFSHYRFSFCILGSLLMLLYRDYYYVYCEAAFATRTLSVLQIVYTRQQNSSLA